MKSYDQILSDLKNKVYHPIYFLSGKESFYIDKISDYIEKNILDDLEKEFNQSVFYGIDVDIDSIISTAKRFPMMASHQVVIVKEAQNIKNIKKLIDFKKDPKKSNDLDLVYNYFENPLKSTILVFCFKYDNVDKRKSFVKMLDEKHVLFESEEVKEYKIPEWIESYVKSENLQISPRTAVILSEYLGNDLTKIANEISKLKINIPANTEITPALIEEFIGISKDFNIFELQSAIGSKNVFKANQIINHFKSNPKENPFVLTLQMLYKYFSQVLMMYSVADKSPNEKAAALGVKPFFVKDFEIAMKHYSLKKIHRIFTYLRDYDMKSKGVDNISVGDGELLKEMIFKIMH